MTDKTKPWLTADHPESIACKKSGQFLYEYLSEMGLDLTGVGVTLSDDKQKAAISIMLKKDAGRELVPKTYDNYEVKVIVTGVIRAL
jgi:hypothetical protein